MTQTFEVTASPRSAQGKSASRRLRRDGKVPAILYGAGQEPSALELNHNDLVLQSDHESFYSSILTLKVAGRVDEKVVIKAMQRHPVRPLIMHCDFLRVSDNEEISLRIPVHFLNAESCPAVKSGGGTVHHFISEVEVTCLPKDLPTHIDVDMNSVGLGKTLHLKELPLPAGVRVTSIVRGGDPMLPVVTIEAPKAVEETQAAAAAAAAAKAKAGGKKK